MHSMAEDLKTENKENAKGISEYGDKIEALDDRMEHRRRKYERCSPNSVRPISYFGSIWELYVLDLKTKVFCRKEDQLHFPMDKGLTVPK